MRDPGDDRRRTDDADRRPPARDADEREPITLLDPDCFTFTKRLEAGFEVFRRELDRLDESEFVRWSDEEAFDGEWLVYPLVEHCRPDDLDLDLERNRRRCPESVRLLEAVPRLKGASFSRLTPGSRIHKHRDESVPGVIRGHLGLHVPRGCNLYFERDHHCWAEGRLLLFNGQETHSVVNESDAPRDILMVDLALVLREAMTAGVSWVPWCPDV